jgi:peptidoglycan/xylan/chitin deacetylase (PgdA/CDA1 family)
MKDPIERKHLSIKKLEGLQKAGWEIGSHGANHINMKRLPEGALVEELSLSKAKLEKYFGEVLSFAYPYGDYNDFICNKVACLYSRAFALAAGGTHIEIDKYKIRRYFASEMLKIISL